MVLAARRRVCCLIVTGGCNSSAGIASLASGSKPPGLLVRMTEAMFESSARCGEGVEAVNRVRFRVIDRRGEAGLVGARCEWGAAVKKVP